MKKIISNFNRGFFFSIHYKSPESIKDNNNSKSHFEFESFINDPVMFEKLAKRWKHDGTWQLLFKMRHTNNTILTYWARIKNPMANWRENRFCGICHTVFFVLFLQSFLFEVYL